MWYTRAADQACRIVSRTCPRQVQDDCIKVFCPQLWIQVLMVKPRALQRAGSLGVAEVIVGEAARRDDAALLQRADLVSLGRLLLAIACASQHATLDYCAAHFSPELTRVIATLLGMTEGGPLTSWRQVLINPELYRLCQLHQRCCSRWR